MLSYYLGIEVDQSSSGIILSQGEYASKLLDKAGMGDCNPAHNPMEPRLKLSKKCPSPPTDATFYRSVVGSLCYHVHTRTDITFVVGYISRFMEVPTTEHLAAVKHLFRYIAGTKDLGCKYTASGELRLPCFSDSDMAGDVDDRKSTTGAHFLLGASLISWQSQKQKVVALSSCEAEYIAAMTSACQGVWLNRLLQDLLVGGGRATTIPVDNKSAIQLCKTPVFHNQSKHIELHFHFIRECIDDGKIYVDHINTGDQLADILTRSLARTRFVINVK